MTSSYVMQVPDTYAERKLRSGDIFDRDASDAVLDEINEADGRGRTADQGREPGSDHAVSHGPDPAKEALRKGLAMSADSAVHLSGEALKGSCAVQTARALASANPVGRRGGPGERGNEASDGGTTAVPAMWPRRSGCPR
jgi:electron transfer flavoprotein beta subunit